MPCGCNFMYYKTVVGPLCDSHSLVPPQSVCRVAKVAASWSGASIAHVVVVIRENAVANLPSCTASMPRASIRTSAGKTMNGKNSTKNSGSCCTSTVPAVSLARRGAPVPGQRIRSIHQPSSRARQRRPWAVPTGASTRTHETLKRKLKHA